MSDKVFIGYMVFSVVFLVAAVTWQTKVLTPMPKGKEKTAKTFWFVLLMLLYIAFWIQNLLNI